MNRATLFFVATLAAAQPSPPEAVFRAGTRLVEVDVTIRDQPVRPPGAGAWVSWVFDSGPPFGPPGVSHIGLTKDDFKLLDDGKPQKIAVFRAGATSDSRSDKPAGLPPGTVSNRRDTGGQPVNGATSVLIDFLNTNFGCRGYERMAMTDFLRRFAGTDSRIALYTLGEKLHILHDFTDEPQKLLDAAAKLSAPHGKRPADLENALGDLGDIISVGGDQAEAAAVHGPMTVNAMRFIVRHLAGVPGRKNLVWLMEDPHLVPPAAIAMAQQANIVVYPVLVRLVGSPSFGPDESCVGSSIPAAKAIAAVTGGRAFFDGRDLTFAVRATKEDTGAAYVLGYYPPQETLDGKYHQLTVKLRNKVLERQDLDIHYRPGYLATKAAAPPPSPTLAELFYDPLEFTSIGLTGQVAPSAEHPGLYDVRVKVDLHDIHLEPKDGQFTGAFELSIPNPSSKGTAKTVTFSVNLTEAQLAESLDKGGNVTVSGVESDLGKIRVVARDRATGAAGSLLIPVGK
jgi:VWFA-related protein